MQRIPIAPNAIKRKRTVRTQAKRCIESSKRARSIGFWGDDGSTRRWEQAHQEVGDQTSPIGRVHSKTEQHIQRNQKGGGEEVRALRGGGSHSEGKKEEPEPERSRGVRATQRGAGEESLVSERINLPGGLGLTLARVRVLLGIEPVSSMAVETEAQGLGYESSIWRRELQQEVQADMRLKGEKMRRKTMGR